MDSESKDKLMLSPKVAAAIRKGREPVSYPIIFEQRYAGNYIQQVIMNTEKPRLN